MQTKFCPKCRVIKNLSEWSKNRKRRDGLQSWCRECMNKNARKKYKENPRRYLATRKRYRLSHQKERISYSRKAVLNKKFTLSIDDYEKLKQEQKGVCAICGLPEKTTHPKGTKWSLAVDHNHNTDKIRGLLCKNCNTALGMLNVDNLGILNLQMAIKYLQKEVAKCQILN